MFGVFQSNSWIRHRPPLDSIAMVRNTRLHFKFHVVTLRSGYRFDLMTITGVAECQRLIQETTKSVASEGDLQAQEAGSPQRFPSGVKV